MFENKCLNKGKCSLCQISLKNPVLKHSVKYDKGIVFIDKGRIFQAGCKEMVVVFQASSLSFRRLVKHTVEVLQRQGTQQSLACFCC